MREELELYLEELRANLEIEIDLHGVRSEMARNMRNSIISTEIELRKLGAA